MYLAWGEDTLDAGAAGWVRSVVGKKPNRIRIRWRTGAWTGETDTRGDAHRLRVARRGGGVLWGGMSARACACVKIFHGGWPWPTANRGPVGGVTKTGKSEEPTRNKIAVAAGHASGVCGGVPTPHRRTYGTTPSGGAGRRATRHQRREVWWQSRRMISDDLGAG